MREPSPRSSRLALAGAVAAAILVGGGGFLLGRSTAGPAEIPPPPVAEPVQVPEPEPTPAQRAVLGRADLIALSAAAADAAAAGRDAPSEIAQTDGRRFQLRLPFGCHGPAGEGSRALMHWRYDTDGNALRIEVSPIVWTAQDWWLRGDTGTLEAIEGFWITRPWTSSEACPQGGDRPAATGTEPVTLPGQTLALGQLFFADGTRGARRNGEPYRAVVRVPKDKLDVSQGFRLRVSGRVVATRAASPVQCRQPVGPEQRPICLISVVMDEVAIENPASGKALATWTFDRPGVPEA